MKDLYMYKQLKNGKWRLYRSVSQAVTAWRGTNDKITTVREQRCSEPNYGEILTFATKEGAIAYCKNIVGRSAYEWSYT